MLPPSVSSLPLPHLYIYSLPKGFPKPHWQMWVWTQLWFTDEWSCFKKKTDGFQITVFFRVALKTLSQRKSLPSVKSCIQSTWSFTLRVKWPYIHWLLGCYEWPNSLHQIFKRQRQDNWSQKNMAKCKMVHLWNWRKNTYFCVSH